MTNPEIPLGAGGQARQHPRCDPFTWNTPPSAAHSPPGRRTGRSRQQPDTARGRGARCAGRASGTGPGAQSPVSRGSGGAGSGTRTPRSAPAGERAAEHSRGVLPRCGRGGAGGLGSAHPAEHSGDPTLRCPRRRRTTRRGPTALRAPTRLARLQTGAAPGHACAEGRRRGSPTCTAPMAITHMQNKKMPRGTSGKVTIKENCSQKTQSAACRPSCFRPAAERAGGGGWARGLLPPEQLRGMFELRLGSRKPRPQFSWTLAVSGGQGYGDHTLR